MSRCNGVGNGATDKCDSPDAIVSGLLRQFDEGIEANYANSGQTVSAASARSEWVYVTKNHLTLSAEELNIMN